MLIYGHIHTGTHPYYNDSLEKLFSSIFFLAPDKLIVLLDKGRETERERDFLAMTVAYSLSLTLSGGHKEGGEHKSRKFLTRTDDEAQRENYRHHHHQKYSIL